MEKGRLNNGKTIEVTPEMFEEAAKDFSEGNEGLRKLLMYCFENNIKTIGCCSGHNGETTPYIAFELSDQNMQAILKILKNLPCANAIECLILTKQPGVTSNFAIHMQDNTLNNEAGEAFERILRALQDEKEVEVSDLNDNRQSMVLSMQNHRVPSEYFEIQESDDTVSIVLGKDYKNVLEPGTHTRPWREGGCLVEYLKRSESEELGKALHRLVVSTKYYGCIEDIKIITDDVKASEINDTVGQIKQEPEEKDTESKEK